MLHDDAITGTPISGRAVQIDASLAYRKSMRLDRLEPRHGICGVAADRLRATRCSRYDEALNSTLVKQLDQAREESNAIARNILLNDCNYRSPHTPLTWLNGPDDGPTKPKLELLGSGRTR